MKKKVFPVVPVYQIKVKSWEKLHLEAIRRFLKGEGRPRKAKTNPAL